METSINDSILRTIRQMIGPEVNYDAFDTDLIVNINSALMTLNQLGVGPEKGFVVTGEDETWANFLGDFEDLESVKMYTYIKTKTIFDPPSNSSHLEMLKEQAKELEWRINVQVEGDDHNAD